MLIILIYEIGTNFAGKFWASDGKGGFMHSYNLNSTVANSSENIPGLGRSLLQVYIGDKISENEASKLLSRIADHKWYVSEKLDRDVGFHVAAIDYVENFYVPHSNRSDSRFAELFRTVGNRVFSAAKMYLEAKGANPPI